MNRTVKPSALLAVALLVASAACGSGASGSNESAGGASSITTSSMSSASSGSGGSAAATSSTSSGSVKVNACDGLADVGTFEEITPPELKTAIDAAKGTSNVEVGTFAIAADPVNLLWRVRVR